MGQDFRQAWLGDPSVLYCSAEVLMFPVVLHSATLVRMAGKVGSVQLGTGDPSNFMWSKRRLQCLIWGSGVPELVFQGKSRSVTSTVPYRLNQSPALSDAKDREIARLSPREDLCFKTSPQLHFEKHHCRERSFLLNCQSLDLIPTWAFGLNDSNVFQHGTRFSAETWHNFRRYTTEYLKGLCVHLYLYFKLCISDHSFYRYYSLEKG